VHDCQLDYYGKQLATCSSDHTIKIFDCINSGDTDSLVSVAELKGHTGPVWQVSWAHPKFGRVIASASYDKSVIVWREDTAKREWEIWYRHTVHELSVNTISFGPIEYGLVLACGSSDGAISILSFQQDRWSYIKFAAHNIGVSSLSWGEAIDGQSIISGHVPGSPQPRRLASGGCDGLVKIWVCRGEGKWEIEHVLDEYKGAWIRDVAWAPNIGLPYSTIASGTQDGSVFIHTRNYSVSENWESVKLPSFNDIIWRLSWSITGNVLAVTSGDNKVTLWKQSLEQNGTWKELVNLNDISNIATNTPSVQDNN